MKQLMEYYRIELKRMSRGMLAIIIGTCVAGILLVGVITMCLKYGMNNNGIQEMNIGIVAEEEEPYLDWIMGMLQNVESVQYSCNFYLVSEKEGEEMLRNGKYNCICIIPSNYIDSLLDGENKPVTIRFGKGQATIVHYLLKEITDAVSEYILSTEAGVYTMYDYYDMHDLDNKSEDGWKLNFLYLEEVFGRINLMEEELYMPDELSFSSYYFVAGIVLFFLCMGLSCGHVLIPTNRAFRNALKRAGIGYGRQIGVRGAGFLTVYLCNYVGIVALMMLGIKLSGGIVLDLSFSGTMDWIGFFIKIVPVVVMSGTCIWLVYEIFEDMIGGTLFLFFFVFVNGYFSGCFYPFEYMPEAVQHIAAGFPMRVQFQYIADCLKGGFSGKYLTGIILYTVLFYGIVVIKWRYMDEKN